MWSLSGPDTTLSNTVTNQTGDLFLPQSNPVMIFCIWVPCLNSLLVTATLNQLVGGLLVLGEVWGVVVVKELSFGLRNTHPRPSAARSLSQPSLAPPSKQSISVVLQGKHIYWLVTACQCGSSGPVAEGISLGRGQGENGGN